jgi:hypothetical protein
MKRPSPLPILAALAMLAIALLASPADGQLLRRPLFGAPAYQEQVFQPSTIVQQSVCNGFDCQPAGQIVSYGPTLQPSVVVEAAVPVADGTRISAEQWYTILVGPNGRTLTEPEKRAAKEWSLRAARTYQGNGCGTSSLCGRDSNSTYWMTNAHVASTTIGRQCRLQVLEGGQIRSFTAVVVEAAYSSRTRTDWALLKGPPDILPDVKPIQLSKEKPDPNKITATWGCPRCEPVRGQIIETVAMGSVWYWLPNSIGGQSGSAVVQDGMEVGVLTWTENGRGSGQFTATIWAQSRNQNTDGPARTGFEIPVVAVPLPPHDLREGYFAAPKETGDLGEYPIWADGPTDPADPTDPAARGNFRVTQIARDPTRFNALSVVVLQSDDPQKGQFVVTGSGFEFLEKMPEVGTPVEILVGASSSTAPQENAWFLDFALYCWEHRDQLADKSREIIALADWFKQFIGDFQQTSDTGTLEAELEQLITATGFPMATERGDLLRHLILYAIANPDQIKKWIEFVKSLRG